MVRRYAEPVLVGTVLPTVPDSPADFEAPPGPGGYAVPAPAWFDWAGRRYHVRAILGRWRERRAWWRDVLDADPATDPAARPSPEQRCAIAVAARERLVWRVEAGPGHLPRTGVFDLACDEGTPGDPDPRGWVLLRVSD